MLDIIIKSLESEESVASKLEALGGRHVIYGVVVSDFISFSNCLSKAIAIVLGDQAKPEVPVLPSVFLTN